MNMSRDKNRLKSASCCPQVQQWLFLPSRSKKCSLRQRQDAEKVGFTTSSVIMANSTSPQCFCTCCDLFWPSELAGIKTPYVFWRASNCEPCYWRETDRGDSSDSLTFSWILKIRYQSIQKLEWRLLYHFYLLISNSNLSVSKHSIPLDDWYRYIDSTNLV